jgi:transcriptional regulator with XRE-family HTH domain
MHHSHASSQALSILDPDMPRRRTYLTPVDEKTIGRRLRELRERRGLTQAQLAEQVGIDQTLVSNYERGTVRLHGALVAGFAKALKASSDEILGIKESALKSPATSGRLLRRLQRIEQLSRADQKSVLKFLDALIERNERRSA